MQVGDTVEVKPMLSFWSGMVGTVWWIALDGSVMVEFWNYDIMPFEPYELLCYDDAALDQPPQEDRHA